MTRRTTRSALLARTALASTFALMIAGAAAPALAQSTNAGTVTSAVTNGGGVAFSGAASNTGGADTSTVTLGGSRTILNWNGFNLTSGDTLNFVFGSKGDIVVNRVGAGSATIDGFLNGRIGSTAGANGGNVWFLAQDGVVFGANARVNVGGLLATTASLTDADFLDGDMNFAFSGATTNLVQVLAGADLRAWGGALALVSQSVSTDAGATIGSGGASSAEIADGQVLYGAATNFNITFAPEADNDLSLVSFQVPTAADGSSAVNPLVLGAATEAGDIYLAAVSRTEVVGATLFLDGAMTAVSATPGENGSIVLGAGRSAGVLDLASGGAEILARFANMDPVSADGDLTLSSNGELRLGAGPGAFSAGGDATLMAGKRINFMSAMSISVGGDYSITAEDFSEMYSPGTGMFAPTFTGGGAHNFSITDTAGGLNVRDLNTSANLSITVQNGDLSLNGVTTTGNLTLDAGTGLVNGNSAPISVGGHYAVTGGDFTGGVFDPVFTGVGNQNFSITDTVGGLYYGWGGKTFSGDLSVTTLNGGGLTINGDLTSTGGNITLAGGGGVTLQGSLTATGAGAGLVTLNGGAFQDSGAITARGLQTSGGMVQLTGAANNIDTLYASTATSGFRLVNTGDLAIVGTVDGGSGLNISTTGALTANASTLTSDNNVVLGGGSLTLNGTAVDAGTGFFANGPITFNSNASVTSGGIQSYTGTVTLGSNTTLTSTGGGDIQFASTLDGGHGLTVSTGGTTIFNGAVGATTALSSLTVNGGIAEIYGGQIRTSGAQTYTGRLWLMGNATLTSTAAGDISFGGDVGAGNSSYGLTVNTSGATRFNSTVGSLNKLGALTTDAGGSTQISGGSIQTVGGQTYGDGVVLGAHAVLSGGTLSYASVSGSGNDLTLNFTGLTAINGANTLGVRNLTTGGGGTTSLAGAITTTGTQTYNDAVNLGGNATLTAAGGADIRFGGSVHGGGGLGVGGYNLLINSSGTTTFDGAVSGVSYLNTDAPGTTVINGGSIQTNQSQDYMGDVVLGANTTLTSYGFVSVNGTVNSAVDGAYGLTVDRSNNTMFIGAVGGTGALSHLSITGTSRIDHSVRTTGAQTYSGLVTAGAGAAFTGGALDFAGLTGQGDLALTAAGTINMTGSLSVTGDYTVTAADFTGVALAPSSIGGDLSITDTAGGLTMGDLSATGNLTVTVQNGGGLTGGVLSAGGDVSVSASGGVDLAGLSAGRDASIVAESGGIAIAARPTIGRHYFVRAADFGGNALNPAFNAVTGGDFTVEDTLGGLAVGALGARGNLTVRVLNGGDFLLDPGSAGLTSQTGDITVITEGGGALQLMGDVVTAADRTVALVSSGALAQLMGRIDTGTLTGSGAANVGLSSATNDIDRLGAFSAGGVFNLVDTGGLTVTGTVSAGGDATVRTVGGDLTLNGGQVSGALVQLATDQDFHNLSGAAAVSASDRWLIYSAGPDGNTYGGLDSGNTAVWGRGFGAAPSQAGNRYVFAVAPTVTFTSTGGTKTYGQNGAGLMSYNVSGLHAGVAGAFQGDTASTAFSGSAALSSAGVDERASVAGGPYVVTISAGDLLSLAGYAMAFDSAGRIVVTPKALTGTVVADDKTYDGGTAGTGTITLTGVVSGDTVGVGGATFTFADKNAGADKVVTVSGATLTGTDAGNYTLTLPATVLADIFRKALTGTVAADDKTYDGTTAATGTVTLGGVVDGDTVSVGGTTFAFADKNAGADKVVTVSGATLTGTDAGNYTLSLPATVLADIFRKALTGTVVADDKTYDGTTAATGTVTLGGVVDGDTVSVGGTTFTFADKNAGAAKVVTVSGATLTGTDAGNYTLSLPATVLADIFRKALTGTVVADDKTYDGTTAGTGTVTLGGVVDGDAVGTSGATFTFLDKNAGTDKVVTVSGVSLTGADAGNYTLTVPASVLADIARRAITVTADDVSKPRGDADPALTWTLTTGSLVEGDALTGALTRDPGEAVGRYAIVQGSLAASSNYDLTFAPGVFEIRAPAADPAAPALAYFQAVRLQPTYGGGQQVSVEYVSADDPGSEPAADAGCSAGEDACRSEEAGVGGQTQGRALKP